MVGTGLGYSFVGASPGSSPTGGGRGASPVRQKAPAGNVFMGSLHSNRTPGRPASERQHRGHTATPFAAGKSAQDPRVSTPYRVGGATPPLARRVAPSPAPAAAFDAPPKSSFRIGAALSSWRPSWKRNDLAIVTPAEGLPTTAAAPNANRRRGHCASCCCNTLLVLLGMLALLFAFAAGVLTHEHMPPDVRDAISQHEARVINALLEALTGLKADLSEGAREGEAGWG